MEDMNDAVMRISDCIYRVNIYPDKKNSLLCRVSVRGHSFGPNLTLVGVQKQGDTPTRLTVKMGGHKTFLCISEQEYVPTEYWALEAVSLRSSTSFDARVVATIRAGRNKTALQKWMTVWGPGENVLK